MQKETNSFTHDYLTSREAADIARVTDATIRRWVTTGRLKATKTITGLLRFERSDVLATFNQQSGKGKKDASS